MSNYPPDALEKAHQPEWSRELDAFRRDAARYRFWRKHYHSDFAIQIAMGGKSVLSFLPGRPMVEIAGPDYEAKVDAAIDAAMSSVECDGHKGNGVCPLHGHYGNR